MSVHINNKRKQWYIMYHSVDENGKDKVYSITNAEWKTSRYGKKYMKAIESEEIIKDKRKRKLKLSKGNDITLEELINFYDKTLDVTFKSQTAYNKRLIINKYIIPYFEIERSLNTLLSISTIDNYYSRITKVEISADRINTILHLFKEILDFGCNREYISFELKSKLCNIMKPIKERNKPKEKLCFWTNEEWQKFIDTFNDDDKFKMLFIVDYMCALRIGELLALKRNDFDPNKKILVIDESVDSLGNITSPKNASSDSFVSLSADLTNKLIQYKLDTAGSENDYIFFADRRTSRTTIRRIMSEHIELAKVPYIKFHGLRHSCASRMINAGCSPLIVSKHLRHASTQQTLDTYSHLFPSETLGLMDKIFV